MGACLRILVQVNTHHPVSGMVCLALKWVRLAPNGTNQGLFKISFSTFWLCEKVQDLSHLGPIGSNLDGKFNVPVSVFSKDTQDDCLLFNTHA